MPPIKGCFPSLLLRAGKTPACEQESRCTAALAVRKERKEKANVNKRQNVAGMNSMVIIAEAKQKAKQEKHFHETQRGLQPELHNFSDQRLLNGRNG